jgi:hypothetical protein
MDRPRFAYTGIPIDADGVSGAEGRPGGGVGSLAFVPRGVLGLMRVYRDNQRLLGRQRQLREQIAEALAYWRREDANKALAWSRLSQLRRKHQAVLAELKANRETVRVILGPSDGSRDDRAAG